MQDNAERTEVSRGHSSRKDNLNRTFKKVKANKGALGVDGMTVNETYTYLREHNHELADRINSGFYDLATAYQSVHVNY